MRSDINKLLQLLILSCKFFVSMIGFKTSFAFFFVSMYQLARLFFYLLLQYFSLSFYSIDPNAVKSNNAAGNSQYYCDSKPPCHPEGRCNSKLKGDCT